MELPLPWDLSVGQTQVCHCHAHPKAFCHASECENSTGEMGLSPALLVQLLPEYQLSSSPGLGVGIGFCGAEISCPLSLQFGHTASNPGCTFAMFTLESSLRVRPGACDLK